MTSGFLRSNPPCYTPPAAQLAAMMTKMENLNLDQLLYTAPPCACILELDVVLSIKNLRIGGANKVHIMERIRIQRIRIPSRIQIKKFGSIFVNKKVDT